MRVWLFLGISVVVSVGWFASSGLMGRVRLRIRWGRMRMARGIAVPARSIVCGVRRMWGGVRVGSLRGESWAAESSSA